MKIRLGYVAIDLNLPKVTSLSHLTFARYNRMQEDKRIDELKRVTKSNVVDLLKTLNYNADNDIHFYRLTSRFIPLATHPEVIDWKFRIYFRAEFNKIGEFIKKHKMRIDTHPDHFNVLNSLRKEVVEKTKVEFLLHNNLFEDMNYPDGKMIIHIGSGQEGKEKSMYRFIYNFNTLPSEVRNRILLENDDKLFTAKEVLSVCRKIDIPMVLDIHHHKCNSGNDDIEDVIPKFLKSWDKETLPPKIHISSPKEGEKDRKHADFINPNDFIDFIEKYKMFNKDLDVMIEAKQKDLALYKLVEDIKDLKSDWKWIDQSTVEIK